MIDIHNYADRLKTAIAENKMGFERDLIQFTQRFALSPVIKKKTVLLSYKLSRDNAADLTINKDEILELIDAIVAGYSEEKCQKKNLELLQHQRQLSNEYFKLREVAYSCSKIRKSFNSDFTLGEISLEIRKGDITGVVGENANGKTTLFRIVAGELTFDSGEVAYPFLQQSSNSKRDIDWGLVKSHIAFVPQELPVWYGNLRHNLQYEAAIHGIKGDTNLLQVDYVIERLGLQKHIDKKWKELSGGFKLRFALAKALVWQPDMMILDEPLANLDVNAQLSILRDIKHLATSISNPIAVFISSQHLHEIEAIADNLVFLRDGKAIFNDSMRKLGIDRSENIFEVGATINYQDFIDLFPESLLVSVRHDGLQYIVTTPLTISQSDILKIFIKNDVDLRYFRDISYSSKKYFMRAA